MTASALKWRRVAVAVAISSALALIAAGCTAVPAVSTQPPSEAAPTSERPTFSGPFAAEYQDAWDKAESGPVRQILEDELISDQEWSQVVESLKKCLSDKGVELTAYNTDGSYAAETGGLSGEASNAYMGECEKESGEAWVGYLYRSQTANPNNTPETQLLTECMIRNQAVPSTYTEEQYLLDAPDFKFPFIDEHGPETFARCNADMGYNR